MLESIALNAGWRVGLYIKPHLVHFEERCRIGGASLLGRRAGAALRGGGGGARRHRAHLLRVHDPGDPARALAGRARRRHPRGGAGRPARCRERDRHRLRTHHQHRDRSRGVSRRRPRGHRLREGRHHAAGQAGHRGRPAAAAERDRACPRASAPTFGSRVATSATRETASSGRGTAASAATARSPIRRCAARTSCSMRPACWRCSRRFTNACRYRRRRCGRAWRWSSCPGGSRSFRASRRSCSTWRTTRSPSAVLAVNLDQMGFYPRTHAVFGAMRDKDLAGVIAPVLPLVDAWHVTALPTAARGLGRGARCAGARRARRRHRAKPFHAGGRPARGRRRRGPH